MYENIDRGNNPSWSFEVQVMPYADAADYRFNPFDLTKVWPNGDYPRIKVGRLTLNRNPENYHAQIEQAAFSPANVVPGIGLSPDKMLLGRVFAYADAQRARIGSNFHQLPVNRPKVPVNTYMFDGHMNLADPADEVRYAPNSRGRAFSDGQADSEESWQVDGDLVRAAYSLHAEDDDYGQAGTLVRDVMDDAARERLIANIGNHMSAGVKPETAQRVFEYWRNVDPAIGAAIEKNFAG